MTNIVVTGASRGLGLALTRGLAKPGDRVWRISRTEPPGCEGLNTTWIPLDLSAPEQLCKASLDSIGDEPIHLLIHSAGIWEAEPFDKTSPKTLLDILNVNVSSAVLMVRLLERNLRAGRGNIVFIGSTWGLENSGTSRVASAASKFGLRGAAHALREHFREASVRVTCINSSWFSKDAPHEESAKATTGRDSRPIPMEDIVELVRCITSLSDASCIKELVITATTDVDV
jgi:NAD(P)-dependent dehydrogenase (short-subunit alcohol dehydrogenase family)